MPIERPPTGGTVCGKINVCVTRLIRKASRYGQRASAQPDGQPDGRQQFSPVEEFERRPVPPHAKLGFGSFWGCTPASIRPERADAWTAVCRARRRAFDFIVGLLVGNALGGTELDAVCALIAVRARLTLYYQLEKICGRKLGHSIIGNGVMFTIWPVR